MASLDAQIPFPAADMRANAIGTSLGDAWCRIAANFLCKKTPRGHICWNVAAHNSGSRKAGDLPNEVLGNRLRCDVYEGVAWVMLGGSFVFMAARSIGRGITLDRAEAVWSRNRPPPFLAFGREHRGSNLAACLLGVARARDFWAECPEALSRWRLISITQRSARYGRRDGALQLIFCLGIKSRGAQEQRSGSAASIGHLSASRRQLAVIPDQILITRDRTGLKRLHPYSLSDPPARPPGKP